MSIALYKQIISICFTYLWPYSIALMFAIECAPK